MTYNVDMKKNTKTFGERYFAYTAPTVWNSLPADLRASSSLQSFKAKLKTIFSIKRSSLHDICCLSHIQCVCVWVSKNVFVKRSEFV